jgi:ketopantoate reductase
VITLQNGVDSVERLAPILGEEAVIAGTTYVVATIAKPGVIHHTGTTARIHCAHFFLQRAESYNDFKRSSGFRRLYWFR